MTGYRYTPDRAGADELKFNFIGRDSLFQMLEDRVVKSGTSGAFSHCILIGPRGIGKSHLLNLLFFTVKEKLSDSWIPIKFSEEEYYSIISLPDLFLKILEYLHRETGDKMFIMPTPGKASTSNAATVETALAIIIEWQKTTSKKILLMPENMHKILPQITEEERERLRGILIGAQPFLIIGSAISVFDQILEHEEPFFNFFDPIRIEDLASEEIEELILRREEYDKKTRIKNNIEEFRPKIRAISRLTGGNPRLALFLYELITEKEISSVEEIFVRILEEQTPYYQSVMESITPQQRKIVDMMAVADSPLTSTEIASASAMTVNVVSSQMKRIEDLRIVRPVKLYKKRLTRYEISDRLFRYWRKWRTPAGREKIEFFIDFLKSWYQPPELRTILDRSLEICMKESENQDKTSHFKYALYCYEALSMKEKMEKFTELFDVCIDLNQLDTAEKELGRIEGEVKTEDQANSIELKKIRLLLCKEKFQEALEKTTENIDKGNERPEFFRFQGVAFDGLKMHEDAIKCYDKAIELGDVTWNVWINRGLAFVELLDHENALKSFEKAVEKDQNDHWTWELRGNSLIMLKRFEEAVESFDKAIVLGNDCSAAWEMKGNSLRELEKYTEALLCFDRAKELDSNEPSIWTSRGVVLCYLDRYDEAIQSYDEAIKLNDNISRVWRYRGHALSDLGKQEEAIECYNKAISLDGGDICSKISRAKALIDCGKSPDIVETIADIAKHSAEKAETCFVFYCVSMVSNLVLSWQRAAERNFGDAEKHLLEAMEVAGRIKKEDLNNQYIGYIRNLFSDGSVEFAETAIEMILKAHGEGMKNLMHPFSQALKYIQTKDKGILEQLQQEERELVLEIVNEATGGQSAPKKSS